MVNLSKIIHHSMNMISSKRTVNKTSVVLKVIHRLRVDMDKEHRDTHNKAISNHKLAMMCDSKVDMHKIMNRTHLTIMVLWGDIQRVTVQLTGVDHNISLFIIQLNTKESQLLSTNVYDLFLFYLDT